MILSQIKLKGYRNFKNETINLAKKTLIIGANDVGKSNLLHALRILLDRSLSEIDIEPLDSDFYAYEDTNTLSIIIKFEDVREACVISKLKGSISDAGELYLAYFASRDPRTKAKTYLIKAGHREDQLVELEERYYRKVLNLKYIGSTRDIYSYIKREKRNLLQDAKDGRNSDDELDDNKKLLAIEGKLKGLNRTIRGLSFIENATTNLNKELSDLSFRYEDQEVVFSSGESDINSFVDNIQLSCKTNSKIVALGGDGRNNQIFLALWAARNEIQTENSLEVTFYCIEEPEAHLHPHQQRKLAEYLYSVLKRQIIITTHSPQIAAEFSPNSVVRLYEDNLQTKAANNGCSEIIGETIVKFGHRLNIIPAEAFFSRAVMLVEGASEVLFYRALAKAINIDLDKLNISIVMVDGVDFAVYVKMLTSLNIPCVIKTDNDIFKIPRKRPIEYRYAGVERAVDLYSNCLRSLNPNLTLDSLIATEKSNLRGFNAEQAPKANKISADKFIRCLKNCNVCISNSDLETDLINSEINADIKAYLDETDDCETIKEMQKRKATFMYEFLSESEPCLSKLGGNTKITYPLKALVRLIRQ